MIKPNVIFLCTGNSCRSQMAEGWLRHMAGDSYTVFSAGLDPSTLHPLAAKVMAEVGIDISEQYSKDVASFLTQGKHFHYIITVCDRAKMACPIFPGVSSREHWPIDDPAHTEGTAEEKLVFFRRVRDEIRDRVKEFVENPYVRKSAATTATFAR